MNRIITTSISDPLIQQPLTGKSLDFLQNNYSAGFLALGQSLIGETFDISTPYILKGLDAFGTNQYNEGWVFYFGEIYYCPGKATTTAFSNVPVLTLTVSNDSTADPVTFTDGVPRNVHNNRTMVLSDAVSGSGTFDLSDAVYLQQKLIRKEIQIGDWNMHVSSGGVASVAIAHGLTFSKIRSMSAIIYNDAATAAFNLVRSDYAFAPSLGSNYISADATNINLQIETGSVYDSTSFDLTSFNRGFIVVEYMG